jgi:hypothetical protein
MKKRNVLVPLFLLALIFVVFLIRRWNEPRRKEAFERHPAELAYSSQALCQMTCRNISKKEIETIMQKGIIIFNRSNRMARPCPTFALQGRTSSEKSLRVFFLQCDNETSVMAIYLLNDTTACPCSGSEKKVNQ